MPLRPPAHRAHGRVVSYRRCLALVAPLVLLWCLATPVMGVVDAYAHVAAAAADVRGQLDPPVGRDGRSPLLVPAGLADLEHVADCLSTSNDTLPTQCRRPARATGTVTVLATTGRYPPLWYLLIGWPSLLVQGDAAYWGIVLAAAVVDSLLLSAALWMAVNFARSPLGLVGWLAALTPEALYLTGTPSDSGFEIAAAVAGWVGLTAVATTDEPDSRLLAATAVSLCCLTLARPASPAWTLMAVAGAAVVAGRRRLRVLSGRTQVRIAAAVVAASGLVAVAYRLGVGSPQLLSVSAGAHPGGMGVALRTSADNLPVVLRDGIGVWFATFLPASGLVAWVAAAGLLIMIGLVVVPRRVALAALVLMAAIVAVPVLADAAEFRHIGLWWQGRDSLPFAVGVPIMLAGAVAPRRAGRRTLRRVAVAVVVVLALTQVGAFVWVLHRYAAGVNGGWSPFHLAWEPPGGFVLLAVLFVVATVLEAASVLRWTVVGSVGRPRHRSDESSGLSRGSPTASRLQRGGTHAGP